MAVERADSVPFYDLRVCGEAPEVRTRAFGLGAPYGLDELPSVDTIVIPGIDDPTTPVAPTVLAAIRQAWAAGARVASICAGAFVLAATGLLNGRRATTHWLAASLRSSAAKPRGRDAVKSQAWPHNGVSVRFVHLIANPIGSQSSSPNSGSGSALSPCLSCIATPII